MSIGLAILLDAVDPTRRVCKTLTFWEIATIPAKNERHDVELFSEDSVRWAGTAGAPFGGFLNQVR